MASGGEKTEKATPKRREEARKKGQVARSQRPQRRVVLLAGLFALVAYGPSHDGARWASRCARRSALIATPQAVTAARPRPARRSGAQPLDAPVAPIARVCRGRGPARQHRAGRVQAVAREAQARPEELNPVAGLKNLFGTNMLVETAKALVKVGDRRRIVALRALAAAPRDRRARRDAPAASCSAQLAQTVLGDRSARGVRVPRDRRSSTPLAAPQAREVAEDDKQEVKEEAKQTPPRRRSARRCAGARSQAARARMMAERPERRRRRRPTRPTSRSPCATTPSKPAPEVVAKGQDLVAAQIRADRRRARRAGRLRPAARALAVRGGRGRHADPRGALRAPSPRCSPSSTAPLAAAPSARSSRMSRLPAMQRLVTHTDLLAAFARRAGRRR